MINSKLSILSAIVACGLFAGVATASPVAVDGVIGAEWAGVPAITINHDGSAAEGNFSSPGSTTDGAGYTVQVRDDGTYYYAALHVTDMTGFVADFANLYFDTDPQNGNGSDIGFEVTNNDYFVPGVTGSYNASPYLTYAVDSSTHTIELAIANSFFTSPPSGLFPAATGDVVLRLSQSFGYSVAGGDATTLSVTSERLGSAGVAAAPLPSAAGMGLAVMGIVGMAGVLRKKLRTA